MINLSLEELRLIAQNRNIRDYENKSEKDLIKALSEPKPKISQKKSENFFNELRHKFSKKEVDKYRKTFYDIKKLQTSFNIRHRGGKKKSYQIKKKFEV